MNERRASISASAGRPLPREHGGWGMIGIAFLAGTIAAARAPLASWLWLAAALSGFAARGPLYLALRRRLDARTRGWLAGTLAVGSASLLGLAALGRAALVWAALAGLPLLALHLAAQLRRQDRSPAVELAGALLLAAMAPTTTYAALGRLPPAAVWQWLALGGYFAAGVTFVRARLAAERSRRTGLEPLRRWALASHLTCLGLVAGGIAVAVAVDLPGVRWLLPVAYVPALVKSLAAARRGWPRERFQRIGWIEVAHGVLFAALSGLAW